MKSSKSECSVKKACGGVAATIDIEAGNSLSREKKTLCATDLIHSFLPCIFERTTLSLTESTENRNLTPCRTKSESIVVLSKSESFQEGSKPPPLVLPDTSSETEEDDEIDKSIAGNYSQTDPFASREGKTLCWRNVDMTLVSLPQRKIVIDCLNSNPCCSLFHTTRLVKAISLAVCS